MDLQNFTSIATPANKEQLEENATHLKLKRKQWDESSSCSVCAGPITRQPSPHLSCSFYHSSILHLALSCKNWSSLYDKAHFLLVSYFWLIQSHLSIFFFFFLVLLIFLVLKMKCQIFQSLKWWPRTISGKEPMTAQVPPPSWATRLVIGHCVKWMCGIRHTPPSPLVSYQ